MKARAADLKELVLTDVCPFTLGVAVLDRANPERLMMSPLLERNCVLPSSREDVYTTAYDGQDNVLIEVYQGENLCSPAAGGHLLVHPPPGGQPLQPALEHGPDPRQGKIRGNSLCGLMIRPRLCGQHKRPRMCSISACRCLNS